MQRKYSLDTLAVRDTAHGESFVEPATFPADHYAGKDLDPFLVPFHNACVHAHAIANRERCGIAFLLFFFNDIDHLIHKLWSPAARLRGRTLSFEGTGFASRNRQPFGHEPEARAQAGQHQKICENLPDLWLIPVLVALVAQLDRALASGAKGCGFDPRRAHNYEKRVFIGKNDLFLQLPPVYRY
jgi:hypothetical protein